MNSSAKVLKIEVIEKKKRLDKDFDHLVKLIMADDEVYYLALRITDDSVISLWVDSTTPGLLESTIKFVSTPKKRTLIACVRSIVKAHPKTLSNSPANYYSLIKDDTDTRLRNKLAKRKWKVHQLAIWKNGYFVARLSCSKVDNQFSTHSQFVLHPSKFDVSNGSSGSAKSSVYLRHGSFNSPVKVNIPRLKFILRHSEEWPKLSVMLNEAEYGYSTEVEAKDGFDKLVSREDIAPASIIKNSLTNSIRQVKPDNELPVTIIDTYKHYHEAAWLFHAGDEHFIMRMEAHTEDKVTLFERGVSTVFKNIDQAARQLISLCKSKGMSGDTKELAVSAWQEMIIRDLNFRYFCEQLNADWLVTDIAKQQGVPVAIIAQCFTSSVLAVPVHAKLKTYKVLLVESGRIIDPSRRGERYQTSNKINLAEFKESIKELETNTFNKVPLKLKDALVFNRGFVTRNEATQALESSSHDEIKVLTAGACPLMPDQRLNLFKYNADNFRNRIVTRINEGKSNANTLDIYEKSILEKQTYPIQLIKILIKKRLLSKEVMGDLLIQPNIYRKERNLDQKITAPSIKSTPKSNAGRKRKYKDDKEKKRVWAKKQRDKLKAEKSIAGIKISSPGRQRIYDNSADKQRAYRFKKKWSQLANSSSLLIVFMTHNNINNSGTSLKVHKAIEHFNTKVVAILESGFNNSDENRKVNIDRVQSTFPKIPIHNIYVDTPSNLLLLLLTLVKEKKYKNVHICSDKIIDDYFRLLKELKEIGVNTIIHKDLFAEKK